jgi:ATP-dependent RNA helicase DDX54/DBP10
MRVRRSKITTSSDRLHAAQENPEDNKEFNISLSKGSYKDPFNYASHFDRSTVAEEQGYSVNRQTDSFAEASKAAIMNLAGDDGASFAPTRSKVRWDPKKKNFVHSKNDDDGSTGEKAKMIRGESGVKIPASMKSGRFFLRNVD